MQGVLRGTLALGAEQCIAGVHVAGLLAAFRRQHPDVEIRLRQSGLRRAGRGGRGRPPRPGLRLPHPGRHRPVALGAADQRADDRAVPPRTTGSRRPARCRTPHDLAGEVFVDFHPDWGPRRATDAASPRRAYGGRSPLEVNDVHGLLDLVDENLGIAVVPRHFRHKRTSLTALPLKGADETAYETVALLPPAQATSPRGADRLIGTPALARETEDARLRRGGDARWWDHACEGHPHRGLRPYPGRSPRRRRGPRPRRPGPLPAAERQLRRLAASGISAGSRTTTSPTPSVSTRCG